MASMVCLIARIFAQSKQRNEIVPEPQMSFAFLKSTNGNTSLEQAGTQIKLPRRSFDHG
jgi:hypothetical protein